MELWRIGASSPAPKFNVISKPNEWSRSVAHSARAVDDNAYSERRLLHLEYWRALNDVLERAGGPVRGNRKPQAQSWMSYPVGRTGFKLAIAHSAQSRRRLRAELYISGDNAKKFFDLLYSQSRELENELGDSVTWERLPEKRDCRISIYLDNVDVEDREDWPRQHAWQAERLNRMHRAFAPRGGRWI